MTARRWTTRAPRAALLLLGPSLLAQAPLPVAAHAAFAADRDGTAPALAWLRQVLGDRAEWPAGRDTAAPFTVHWRDGQLWFGAALELPPGVALAGEITIGGATIGFACQDDGREDWRVRGDAVPPLLAGVVAALQPEVDGAPRALDLPALIGNVAGAAVEGDGTAEALALGAVQCGEVTVAVRRDGDDLRVIGRSGGGLSVPALLLWCALQRDGHAAPDQRLDAWRLRAFGARDGDRAEAARQLQRAGSDAVPTLCALLHADEHSRLSAIDGLVRLRAAGELPRIVAAAAPDLPLCVAMAKTAVRELWPLASAATRTATLLELRRSRTLDVGLVTPAADALQPDARWRWLGVLAVVAVGLLGCWLRERAR
jgi:hypothetical protein